MNKSAQFWQGKPNWPEISVTERSWTIIWRASGWREEYVTELGTGVGKENSEAVDVASEPDETSAPSYLAMDPDVELEFDDVCKSIFSADTCSDMLYNILRHTKSYLVSAKWHQEIFFSFIYILVDRKCYKLNINLS